MANLTIAVADDTLRRARLRAIEQQTSVNALLRGYLESYAGVRDERRRAVRELFEIADRNQAARGDRTWTRDELHDR